MKICGFQKTSLLDYPDHISAILFTGGCNFKCPYCHNSELWHPDGVSLLSEESILRFLQKRAGILEGVVITGGEPTLHADLPDLIRRIRDLGLKIKLDTNGSNPGQLSFLLEQQLLDYVAMDVKACPADYAKVSGTQVSMENIRKSIGMIQNCSIPHEFRTTVVKELHTVSSFHQIGELLEGAELCCLQKFVDSDTVFLKGLHPFSDEEMEQAASILGQYVRKVKIR